ncbi:metallophosphoesterase family protein [Cohnella zeiphila]|uniref:Phosphoesterase n=1 Tax=Cohnella zeiphila TaxID=2761120 RepID=A0A7X0SS79_9BACL|nr:metallophosphoesterase family protein [Cohnella zeiphila]MBB6735185.1 metallophosphoesterase family protein [Cohnella zeiphila]
MRIGVVSDTHMPRAAKSLPAALVQAFRRVDRILHAGDWTDLSVLAHLSRIAPVDGVAGNNDGADIVRRLGYRKTIEVGPVRIGLVHGHGDGGRGATAERALKAFADDDVQAVVFGHSHIPMLEERDGVLLFNPGSPTDKRRQSRFSCGLLDIEDGRIRARHVFFEDKSPSQGKGGRAGR